MDLNVTVRTTRQTTTNSKRDGGSQRSILTTVQKTGHKETLTTQFLWGLEVEQFMFNGQESDHDGTPRKPCQLADGRTLGRKRPDVPKEQDDREKGEDEGTLQTFFPLVCVLWYGLRIPNVSETEVGRRERCEQIFFEWVRVSKFRVET